MGSSGSVLNHKMDVGGDAIVIGKAPDAHDVNRILKGSSTQISDMVSLFST